MINPKLTHNDLFHHSLIWQIFSERSGINISNLVEAADTIQNALYPERRDKTIKYMIRHLDHYLLYQREYRGGCRVAAKNFFAKYLCLVCGNRHGNYLVLIYLLTKVVYFSNALVQLFLLSAFLGSDYRMYGFKVLVESILDAHPRRFDGALSVSTTKLCFQSDGCCTLS